MAFLKCDMPADEDAQAVQPFFLQKESLVHNANPHGVEQERHEWPVDVRFTKLVQGTSGGEETWTVAHTTQTNERTNVQTNK